MHARTLLLIEDDFDTREAYGLALRHFGYQVLEAENGMEGLRLARESRPDLILMDLGLPQMDGWEATFRLKHDPETAHIPVMAVTVHVEDFYRGRAELIGCDCFIPKPCSPVQLREEIEHLLSASGPTGSSVRSVAGEGERQESPRA